MAEYKGIDVSYANGKVDWNKVGKQDITFAMIRASYGQLGKDTQFKNNYNGAKANGIKVGAYHFAYCATVADAKKEAKHFLNVIKGYKFEYPIVFDLESNSTTDKAVKLWTDMAIAALEVLEKAGYFAMLYSGSWALQHQFSPKRLTPYAVWVAEWDTKLDYPNAWGIWQYSATGKVVGISGDVDLDKSQYNYSSIIKKNKLNGWT